MLFLLFVFASAQYIADEAFIQEINSKHPTWEAGVNEIFRNVKWSDAKKYLGLRYRPEWYLSLPERLATPDFNAPESFDARTEWPGEIIGIRDQAQCGSCWAFGATEALSDRFNIRDKPSSQIILSPQQLVSCDHSSYGCQGGYPDKAFDYMRDTGVVLDICYPYTSGGGVTGQCKIGKPGDACPSGTGVQKFYHAEDSYRLTGEAAMMEDMMTYGPLEVGFRVYQDFYNYKKGVYHHISGMQVGGHAVKALGWGVDKGTKYWICANSWGTKWAQLDGYFWIQKGIDECGIETWFTVAGKAGRIQ
jgi:cathepsin B